MIITFFSIIISPWVASKIVKEFIFENNIKGIISVLTKLDMGYNPPKKIVDWFFNENIKISSKKSFKDIDRKSDFRG